nr:hypothetical protein [Candidatus Sigynarchaeota archaeon]
MNPGKSFHANEFLAIVDQPEITGGILEYLAQQNHAYYQRVV